MYEQIKLKGQKRTSAADKLRNNNGPVSNHQLNVGASVRTLVTFAYRFCGMLIKLRGMAICVRNMIRVTKLHKQRMR